MKQKNIQTFILGTGSAGKAVAKSLSILKIIQPDMLISSAFFLSRNQSLKETVKNSGTDHFNVIFICGPHGTHAAKILESEAAGFDLILCEKPSCVSLEEVKNLEQVKTPCFVFHGYRQMWGPQLLKEMLTRGDFGALISIEGRYWQSSSAGKAVDRANQAEDAAKATRGKVAHAEPALSKIGWKNDISLGGHFDTLIDLGSHWTDLVFFLKEKMPISSRGFISHVNGESLNRDTHVLLDFDFDDQTRAHASISKTFHGKGNHFEINILGEKCAASWLFERPDEVTIGKGSHVNILKRTDSLLGSRQSPHHGTGWLEGYIEIIYQAFLHLTQNEAPRTSALPRVATAQIPTLSENLNVISTLLQTKFN